MVFSCILALAIILCNSIVIGVLLKNRKLRNSQGIYRISLAFADLLVGLIVVPTYAFNINYYFTENLRHLGFENFTKYLVSNITGNLSIMTKMLPIAHVDTNQFSQSYISFVGFITTTSIIVAICTLTAAGIDRFFAVYRPFSHRNSIPTHRATKITVGIWIVGALVPSFSLWIDRIKYRFTYPTLILPNGPIALFLYLSGICAPFLILWIVTIATLVFYKSHLNKQKRLNRNTQQRKHFMNQMKLMSTLGMMVGVFSVCVAPAIIAVAQHFFEQIDLLRSMYDLSKSSTVNKFVTFEYIAVMLLLTNSLWNFFVYSMRTKLFRSELKKYALELFRKCNFGIQNFS